jgi:hypothetical protein
LKRVVVNGALSSASMRDLRRCGVGACRGWRRVVPLSALGHLTIPLGT